MARAEQETQVKRYAGQRKILRRIIAAKATRRQELADLPIEEKIRIIVRLQQLESSIRGATGRTSRAPWKIAP